MKIIRKILYVIAGLLVLLTILIIICAYNPGVTAKIQKVLFRGRTVENVNAANGTDLTQEGRASVSSGNAGMQAVTLRSLEDLGLTEEDMIRNIDDYYNDCHDQIIARGTGEYSFDNVIATEALVQEIYAKYSNKEYRTGYMDSVLNETGAYSYDMNLVVEELEGKHYKLTHQVVLNEEY
ncbi:MAG: hypothetical protein K6F34_04970 [Lachnospiraceae bacterium]|nr:hypothetical protein [Lachnospiraceae bacterium]